MKKELATYGLMTLLALGCFGLREASATVPECQAKVLQTVTDDLGNTWHPGQVLPMTIERSDSRGTSFCAHGGSCVPTTVAGRPALQLLNCAVGPSTGGTDTLLVPSAALAGKKVADAMAARSSAEQQLNSLGFSNASAGTLANTLVDHPHSRDGRLVARALAGSSNALALLKRSYP